METYLSHGQVLNKVDFFFSTGGKEGGDVGEPSDETVPAREKDRCSAPAGQTREGGHQEEPNHPREAV